jgi:hypothetical protein
MCGTFLFLALFTVGVADPATAQDRSGPATLGGLKGVFLEVYADRDLESSMAALAASRFKAAGITLASDRDWQSTQDIGLLHLDQLQGSAYTPGPYPMISSALDSKSMFFVVVCEHQEGMCFS